MEQSGTPLEVKQTDPEVWLEAEEFYDGYCARCRLPFYRGAQVGVTPRDNSAPQMWVIVCRLCWENLQTV